VRIAIVTDAWAPQVNGVVRTLTAVRDGATARGHDVSVVGPDDHFLTLPCPGDRSVRLAVAARGALARRLDALAPEAIHIATEGPLGVAGRAYCLHRERPFTTAFHTRFPEYLRARYGLPTGWCYSMLRRFHAPSRAVMVAADTVRHELAARGFAHLVPWTRGVDPELFRPGLPPAVELERPIFLFVGRITAEKDLPAFLDLDLPGSKLVVGDGKLLPEMRRRYPAVHFAGARIGAELAGYYATADVLVFPSRTETFGLVMIEALACGVPVAAFPAPGQLDVIGDSGAGVLDADLRAAAVAALAIPRERCREHALHFSWQICVDQFLDHLAWQ
jgi:glycosyltransferase involved in cell wall biosynthesis